MYTVFWLKSVRPVGGVGCGNSHWAVLPIQLLILSMILTGCSNPDEPANPMANTASDFSSTLDTPNTESKKAPPVDALTEKLRKKLHENPTDIDGWVLLARSYEFLGDAASAKGAMNQAKTLGYQGDIKIQANQSRSANKTPHQQQSSANSWQQTDALSKQIQQTIQAPIEK